MPPAGRFTVPVDHPSLAGHFPGRPVVPGVVLLDYAAACLGLTPRRFESVKFLSPVEPGQVIEVSCKPAQAGRVAFRCVREGHAIVTGSIRAGWGEPPPPDPPALIRATGGSPAGSGASRESVLRTTPERFP